MNNAYSNTFLSKRESTYIKGLAILLIVLHNFFHLLRPVHCLENEFVFHMNNYQTFLNEISFSESINALFSFVGYIGIYAFFFLSGYGLTKKIISSNDYLYTVKRIIKLEKLLLLGIVFYVIIQKGDVDYHQIFSKLTLTDNFSLKRVEQISAPMWFLACLAQLYLLFYPLYRFISKYPIGFFIILYVYTIFAYIWIISLYNQEYIYRNCIGHLPEFCFGIYLSCYEQKYHFLDSQKFWLMAFISSLFLFVVAQMFSWVWVFSGLIGAVLILSLFKLVPFVFQNIFIYYTGIISAYIYILHGNMFRFFFVEVAKYASALEKLCWCFYWLCIVYIICSIVYISPKYLKDKFQKNRS